MIPLQFALRRRMMMVAGKDLVAFEKQTTFPGLGTIGIRLRIVQPDTVFSDKIDVKELSHRFKLAREQKRLEDRSQVVDAETKEVEKKVEEKKEKKVKAVKTEEKKEAKPKKVKVSLEDLKE